MRQNHVSAFARSLAITLGLIWAAGVHAEPVSIDHNGLRLNGDLSIADGKSPADPAILLVHGTGAHHGMETISGVQQALLQQGLNVLAVTLSLGVSSILFGATKASDLIDQSDAALYASKQAGRNRVTRWDEIAT